VTNAEFQRRNAIRVKYHFANYAKKLNAITVEMFIAKNAAKKKWQYVLRVINCFVFHAFQLNVLFVFNLFVQILQSHA